MVHYEAAGCDVNMQVLSNCDAPGTYSYFPYDASDSIVAHNAAELYAALPLGAARLSSTLQGRRAVRTDYQLVGVYALKVGDVVARGALQGECNGATHVVSKIYVGSFTLSAGEDRAIDAKATAIGAAGGARDAAHVQHLQAEGDQAACNQASKEGKANTLCSVPLRVALLALPPTCPVGGTWDGVRCAGDPSIAPAVSCPDGATWNGSQCVGATGSGDTGASTFEAAGRVWQAQYSPQDVMWSGATAYCAGLKLAGGGWRLPTIEEMKALHDTALDKRGNPADVHSFWSSSPVAGSPWHNVWYLSAFSDDPAEAKVDFLFRARCVR